MQRSAIVRLMMIGTLTGAAILSACTQEVCYSADEEGFTKDSVRPAPGYVCVARLEERAAGADSVRPDPGFAAGADSVRPAPGFSVELITVRADSLRRRR